MKAFFVDFPGCVPYEIKKHVKLVHKFLYWKDEDILLVGSSRIESHPTIERHGREYAPPGRKNPDGAGEVLQDKIMYWDSTGFKIVTPEELRPKITEALGIEDGAVAVME